MMRDRLEATLDVSLTGREVALLMRRFDEQGKGVVDICTSMIGVASVLLLAPFPQSSYV